MIYVDRVEEYPADYVAPHLRQQGVEWCHLWADSERELHKFATRIGLPRLRFHVSRGGIPHYDLTPAERAMVRAAGAADGDIAWWLQTRHQGIGL
jgi:hypothetical protein